MGSWTVVDVGPMMNRSCFGLWWCWIGRIDRFTYDFLLIVIVLFFATAKSWVMLQFIRFDCYWLETDLLVLSFKPSQSRFANIYGAILDLGR